MALATVQEAVMTTQKIKTFLWYDNQAEEAANFYVSIFPDSQILNIVRNGEGGPGPAGSVLTVVFQLAGTQFVALNGGPHFHFTEAISLTVDCASQEELDRYWNKLIEGGSESQCGWLKDKYGLSWQIVPAILPKLLSDPKRTGSVMQAVMQMKKLDIQKMQDAFDAA